MKDLAQLTLKPMGIDLLNIDQVLCLLLLLFLLIFFDSRHMNSTLVLVIIHLTPIVVIVVTLLTNLAEPVALLVVLVIFIKDNGNTCCIVETLFGADSLVLLLVLNIGTEICDLLGQSVEFLKILVRDGAENLLNVLFPFKVQNSIRLDRSKDLVCRTTENIGSLIPQRLLKSIQQLLIHSFRLLCPRTINLHLRHISAKNRLTLHDVHLSLLLHH
mmetsp:Transcript_43379/g.114247  ORF Transcript_43379/g.114247 Transcript_43379/m.114247 type:complete len:216 (+) Transcript_43379:5646-6293(+)